MLQPGINLVLDQYLSVLVDPKSRQWSEKSYKPYMKESRGYGLAPRTVGSSTILILPVPTEGNWGPGKSEFTRSPMKRPKDGSQGNGLLVKESGLQVLPSTQ